MSIVRAHAAAPRHRCGFAVVALTRALLAVALLPGALLAAPSSAAPGDEPVRVLFLGNSYTQVNDLPALLEQVSTSLGRSVETDRHTPGGNTLGAPQANGAAHAFNATSLAKIASGGWDAVVLQEQSYLPTIANALAAYAEPAVHSLEADVRAASPDARVVLFMTWGRENGGGPFCFGNWCSPAFADQGAMQAALAAAYGALAQVANAVEIAPVGLAWQRHLARAQHADLFKPDGSHPELAGSYLAACVFHARLFDESPVGAAFPAGLAPGTALALQRDAWSTVQAFDCGTDRTFDGAFDLELVAGGGIGASARFEIDGPFGPTPVAAFAVSASPAAIPFAGGVLAIDPSAIVFGPVVDTPAPAAPAAFPLVVPPDPALVGVALQVQGAAVVGGALVLADALEWRPCP